MTPQEFLQSYLDMSEQERLERAVAAGQVVIEFLNQTDLTEEERAGFLFHSIGMFIAADGKLTKGELDLLNKLYNANFTPEQVGQWMGNDSDREFVETMDKLIDSMSEEAKYALCTVGLCVLTSDGELNEYELGLFQKILA